MATAVWNDRFYHAQGSGIYCSSVPIWNLELGSDPLITRQQFKFGYHKQRNPAFAAPSSVTELHTHDFMLYAKCEDGRIHVWELLNSDLTDTNREPTFVYPNTHALGARMIFHQKYMIVCSVSENLATYRVYHAKQPRAFCEIGRLAYNVKVSECCFDNFIFIATSEVSVCHNLKTGGRVYELPDVDSNIQPVVYGNVLFYSPMPDLELYERIMRNDGVYRWFPKDIEMYERDEVKSMKYEIKSVFALNGQPSVSYVHDIYGDVFEEEDTVVDNVHSIYVYRNYLYVAMVQVVVDSEDYDQYTDRTWRIAFVAKTAIGEGFGEERVEEIKTRFRSENFKAVFYKDKLMNAADLRIFIPMYLPLNPSKKTNFALEQMKSNIQGNILTLWSLDLNDTPLLYGIDMNLGYPPPKYPEGMTGRGYELYDSALGLLKTMQKKASDDKVIDESYNQANSLVTNNEAEFDAESLVCACLEFPRTDLYNACYFILYILAEYKPYFYLRMLYKVMSGWHDRTHRDKIMRDIDGLETRFSKYMRMGEIHTGKALKPDETDIVGRFLGQ